MIHLKSTQGLGYGENFADFKKFAFISKTISEN